MREKNIRIPHGEDPGIYLFGRRTLMIDGRAELTDYSEETVIFRPRTGKDLIRIDGKRLTVSACGSAASEVRGRIDSVKYIKELKDDRVD